MYNARILYFFIVLQGKSYVCNVRSREMYDVVKSVSLTYTCRFQIANSIHGLAQSAKGRGAIETPYQEEEENLTDPEGAIGQLDFCNKLTHNTITWYCDQHNAPERIFNVAFLIRTIISYSLVLARQWITFHNQTIHL